jgi:hypothetical protein
MKKHLKVLIGLMVSSVLNVNTAQADEINSTVQTQFWRPSEESRILVETEYTTEAEDLVLIIRGGAIYATDPDGNLPEAWVETWRIGAEYPLSETITLIVLAGTDSGDLGGEVQLNALLGETELTLTLGSAQLTTGAIVLDADVRQTEAGLSIIHSLDDVHQITTTITQFWLSDGNQIIQASAGYFQDVAPGVSLGSQIFYRDANQDLSNGYWDPQGLIDLTLPTQVILPLNDNVVWLIGIAPGARIEQDKAIRFIVTGRTGIRLQIDPTSTLEVGLGAGYGFTAIINYRLDL